MSKLRKRKGTATVELAVAMPLLLVFIFGGMEAANGIFLKQAMTISASAYETAKMASTVGITTQEARNRGQRLLDARGFGAANININPPDTTNLPPGASITVTVSGPSNLNAMSPILLFAGSEVSAQIVMRKN